jgi:hypothetical protein
LGEEKLLVWISPFTILIVRSELVGLLGLILLQEIFIKRCLAFTKALFNGLIASGLAIGKMNFFFYFSCLISFIRLSVFIGN